MNLDSKRNSASLSRTLAGALLVVAASAPISATAANGTFGIPVTGPYGTTITVNVWQNAEIEAQRSAEKMCRLFFGAGWRGEVAGFQEKGSSMGAQLLEVSFSCVGMSLQHRD